MRIDGVQRAVVTDVNDPEGRGRVKVAPARELGVKPAWATVETGDEVLIAFDAGDPRSPVVLGKLWGGTCDKLTIECQGSTIRIDSSGITISASAKVEVNASTMGLSAGMLEVDAGMAKFSGVVQCDTLITNSVIASSYTPGTGNVW